MSNPSTMKDTVTTLFLILVALGIRPLQAKSLAYQHRIVVAKDGSGDFTSIQKAVESCKSFPYETITIFIKKGVYHEKVRIPAWNTKITLIGENRDSTIITYGDYFARIDKGPNSTFYTATLLVQARDFRAENLTIENSAGPVGQAIALDLEADRCAIIHCKILGNQDTVYCAGALARQYFRDCVITGTTDFIFGEATALFEKCILVIKSDSYFTAASTPSYARFGFVFKDCTLKGTPGTKKALLGRPWRKYAKTVFLHCELGDCIAAAGWSDWNDTANHHTVRYAEYQSTGPGASTGSRVGWAKTLSPVEAKRFSPREIFSGIPAWDPTRPD